MKKQKYSLDIQEQEIGIAIDNAAKSQNTRIGESQETIIQHIPKGVTVVEQQSEPMQPESSEVSIEKERLIMKNIWVPESVDCKVKLIRAIRQRQRLPHKFDDIANEALLEYLQNHLETELSSSSE